MHRADMRSYIRTMLSDGDSFYTDAELNRCVTLSVRDISLYYPRKLMYEKTVVVTVTTESFTADHGVAVSLANKPIIAGSEEVIQSSTTFERGTAYEMDYINGTITSTSGGGMSEAGATVSYEIETAIFDLGSELTNLIRVSQVEYPVNALPMKFNDFEQHGTFLIFRSQNRASQARMTEDKHFRIWYEAYHTDPTNNAAGTLPALWDELVILGAVGYALEIKAQLYLNTVNVDLDGSREAMLAAGAVHDAIPTIVTAITAEQALVNTANDLGGSNLTAGKTALDLVPDILLAMNTAFDLGNAQVDLAVADSSRIDGALDLSNAAYDKVNALLDTTETNTANIVTNFTNGTDSAKAVIEDVEDDALDTEVIAKLSTDLDNAQTAMGNALTAANAVWTTGQGTDDLLAKADALTSGNFSAQEYLDLGDALINKANIGERPDLVYAEYSQRMIDISAEYAKHAQQLINEAQLNSELISQAINAANAYTAVINSYVERTRGHIEVGRAVIAEVEVRRQNGLARITEGQARGAEAQAEIESAKYRLAAAEGYFREAELHLGQGQANLDSARSRVEITTAYVAEARSRVESVAQYVAEINVRTNEIQTLINEANAHTAVAHRTRALSETYRLESDRRLVMFRGILRDRKLYQEDRSIGSVLQHPQL